MLIINANIHTMRPDGQKIENGYLRIEEGRFAAIGDMRDAPSAQGGEVLDAGGALLLPGFVDAHTHVGMWEDSLGFEGDDGNEDTDPLTPHMRALDAVNPADRCFADATAAGITSLLTGPGSANPIGGQIIAMKTVGRRVDDMILRAPAGIKFALGENPKSVYHAKSQSPVTRMATAAFIREQLGKAAAYLEQINLYLADDEMDKPEFDAKCESLLPLLRGEIPAYFHAHRADDIFTALRLSAEYGLNPIIIHGTEGHKIADLLAAEQAPVLCGPILCDRSKPELTGLSLSAAAVLTAAGVQTAIVTDHPVTPVEYLPLCAALAVRGGLGREDALKALTIEPARITGLADRVGSIESGKDADLTLFDSDPLSATAMPRVVFCDGRRVR